MNRATLVYLVMIVVLVGGLWLVLELGSALQAPQDLAGRWELSSAPGVPAVEAITVEQSGRFFQISFDHGRKYDLHQSDETDRRVLLSGDHGMISFDGLSSDDKQITVTQTGSADGHWFARRTNRKYPSDNLPAKPPTTAPAKQKAGPGTDRDLDELPVIPGHSTPSTDGRPA